MTKWLPKKAFLSSCIILFSTNLSAQDNHWQFEIAPYLWGVSMNGDVGVGPFSSHISQDFNDLLKQFDGGGMLWLSARKNNWDLFANGMYIILTKNSTVSGIQLQSKNKFGLYTVGVAYKTYEKNYENCSSLSIEPYIGARITTNNATVSLVNTNLSANNSENWTDPIIGARLNYHFNTKWDIILAADIGGTNFNNQKSYNLNGLIAYSPTKRATWATIYLGYRLLYQNYATGSGSNYFLWKMHMFGPLLGLGISF